MYLVVGQGPEHKPNTIMVQKLLHVLDNKRGEIRPRKYLVKPEQLTLIPGFNNVIQVQRPNSSVPSPHNNLKHSLKVPNLESKPQFRPLKRNQQQRSSPIHIDQYDSTSDEDNVDEDQIDEDGNDLLEG